MPGSGTSLEAVGSSGLSLSCRSTGGPNLAKTVPRLVLHVGIHKTGTTTLQVALRSLRPQLRRHGVALITIEQMKKLPHEDAWAARRSRNPVLAPKFRAELRALVDEEISAIEKTGASIRTVLISNERMVGARMPSEGDSPVFRPKTEDAINEVIDAIEPGEVEVTLYTRRQDRLMESCYLWEIQKGLSHSIHDQFPYMDEPVMSYFELASRILAIPRVGDIRVRPFEMIKQGSLAYLDDFLTVVDLKGSLDYSEFEEDPAANLSYSQQALDIAMMINPLLDTRKQKNSVRRFLKSHFPIGEYPSAQILSAEERLRLIELYRGDNERLFATFMPDLPADSYSELGKDAQLATPVSEQAVSN